MRELEPASAALLVVQDGMLAALLVVQDGTPYVVWAAHMLGLLMGPLQL